MHRLSTSKIQIFYAACFTLSITDKYTTATTQLLLPAKYYRSKAAAEDASSFAAINKYYYNKK